MNKEQNKENVKLIIKEFIDILIPSNKIHKMPSASEAINFEDFFLLLKKDENFWKLFNETFIQNKFDRSINDECYLQAIATELQKNRKLEGILGDTLINLYFKSSKVLESLSKMDKLINTDYTNLITSSEMMEKIFNK
jgi:hypothetical protein